MIIRSRIILLLLIVSLSSGVCFAEWRYNPLKEKDPHLDYYWGESTIADYFWSKSSNQTNLTGDKSGSFDFTTSGDVSNAADTDKQAVFGRAKIGDVIGIADYAGFAHYDNAALVTYAFLQSSAGETFLNAKTGTSLHLRDNNSDMVIISNTLGGTNLSTFGAGFNPYAHLFGYITTATAPKYAAFQVDDTDDRLALIREDANILGFRIGMPVTLGTQTGNQLLTLFNNDISSIGFGVQVGEMRLHVYQASDNFNFYPTPDAVSPVATISGTGAFTSTVATGTQPYACSSTTLNTNLNADLWDGDHQPADAAGALTNDGVGNLSWVVYLTSIAGQDHSTLNNLTYATAGHTGFEPTVTKSNLTASLPVSVSNSPQIIGASAADISISQSGAASDGYLSSIDWNTFNNKIGTETDPLSLHLNGLNWTASAPLNYNSGTTTLSITQSGAASDGYLSSVDWNTFNNKSDEKVKVSANDTTAGYLNGKLVGGAGITLTENNDGGDETLTIDSLWTDAGVFTYLISTTDHIVIGASTEQDASSMFQVLAPAGSEAYYGKTSGTNTYEFWGPYCNVAIGETVAYAGKMVLTGGGNTYGFTFGDAQHGGSWAVATGDFPMTAGFAVVEGGQGYGLYSSVDVRFDAEINDSSNIGAISVANRQLLDNAGTSTMLDWATATTLKLYASNVEQVDITDGAISPTTDNDIDLGVAVTNWFKDSYIKGKMYVGETGSYIWSSVANQIDVNADTIVSFTLGDVGQLYIIDGAFLPSADNDIDIGGSSNWLKDEYLKGTLYFADTSQKITGTVATSLDLAGTIITFAAEGTRELDLTTTSLATYTDEGLTLGITGTNRFKSGFFYNTTGTCSVGITDGTNALTASDGTNTANLCDATYGVNASTINSAGNILVAAQARITTTGFTTSTNNAGVSSGGAVPVYNDGVTSGQLASITIEEGLITAYTVVP